MEVLTAEMDHVANSFGRCLVIDSLIVVKKTTTSW